MITKVFWGARQLGKTTALAVWGWGKQVAWLAYDKLAARLIKDRVENAIVYRNTEDVRGLENLIIDDIERWGEESLTHLSYLALNVAISFTPPAKEVTQDHWLLKLSKLPCATRLEVPRTMEQIRGAQKELTKLYFKAHYLGEFIETLETSREDD